MIKCLFNMFIAYIVAPFVLIKQEIWLIGGNAGELYVDNGRAMHEFLLNNKDNIKVYWVVNKDSKIREYFDDNNIPYLIKGSIKSYIYFMKSRVSLFSHSISADIVPYLCVVPIISYYHKKNYKVFLNHGTVGLKKRIAMNKKYEKQIQDLLVSYNLNPCDSEFEKNIKVEDWKMPENSMYVCGYTRYDKLYNMSKNNIETKDILYIPTWRKYNITGIDEFLKSDILHKYLKDTNQKLKVYMHQLSKTKLENEYDENIQILDKNTVLFDEIIRSKTLITDYSSMCYDFMFLNKKVVFYQFDKKQYLKEFGSYVDLDNFYIKSNVNIEEVIEELKNENVSDYSNYFTFIDNKNCFRLYERIKKEINNG